MNERDLTPGYGYEEKKQQQQEQRYHSSKLLHPGEKAWSFNMDTKELKQVDGEKDKTYDMATGDTTQATKIIAAENCVYVTAINKKNAMRKVLAMFGYRYDKKTRTGGLVPGAKEVRQKKIVYVDKDGKMIKSPTQDPGAKSADLKIVKDQDPDAESDHQEPFENDGAYADDDREEEENSTESSG